MSWFLADMKLTTNEVKASEVRHPRGTCVERNPRLAFQRAYWAVTRGIFDIDWGGEVSLGIFDNMVYGFRDD